MEKEEVGEARMTVRVRVVVRVDVRVVVALERAAEEEVCCDCARVRKVKRRARRRESGERILCFGKVRFWW